MSGEPIYSDDELKQIIKIANRCAAKWTQTSLGYEDYAATAIERLLKLEERPPNIEAWLKMVVKNIMIDRSRKPRSRLGIISDLDSSEVMNLVMGAELPSLSSLVAKKLDDKVLVARLLEKLPPKEQQLLLLDAAGYSKAEIAEELGYASARVAGTRIIQIRRKLGDSLSRS